MIGFILALLVFIVVVIIGCGLFFYLAIRFLMPWISYLLDNEDRWEQEFMMRRLTGKPKKKEGEYRNGGTHSITRSGFGDSTTGNISGGKDKQDHG